MTAGRLLAGEDKPRQQARQEALTEIADRLEHACDVVTAAERVREDFLDYPTAWALQNEGGLTHLSSECSAVVGSGAFLCDCGAVVLRWADRVEDRGAPRPDTAWATAWRESR